MATGDDDVVLRQLSRDGNVNTEEHSNALAPVALLLVDGGGGTACGVDPGDPAKGCELAVYELPRTSRCRLKPVEASSNVAAFLQDLDRIEFRSVFMKFADQLIPCK